MGPAEKLFVLWQYFGSIALKSGLKRCFGEICLRGWIPFGWIHGRPRLQGWGVPGGGFFLIKGLEFIDPPLTQLRTPPHRILITTDFGKFWFQCLNFEHKEITGLCTSETFFWGEILHNKSHFWGGFQRPRPDGTYDGRTHICVMLRSHGAYGGPLLRPFFGKPGPSGNLQGKKAVPHYFGCFFTSLPHERPTSTLIDS